MGPLMTCEFKTSVDVAAPVHDQMDGSEGGMSRLAEIAEISVLCGRARSFEALGQVVERVTWVFGLQSYALFEVRNRRFSLTVLLSNEPADRIERIVREVKLGEMGRAGGSGWRWAEHQARSTSSDGAPLVNVRTHEEGGRYAVAVSSADDRTTVFHTDFGLTAHFETAMVARLIGGVVASRAHELSSGSPQRPRAPVRLSPRQVACISLIGSGLSDVEAARRLGLSPGTVGEYVESARQKYGVKRRTQLVLAAIRDGHLSLEDALENASGV